MLANTARNLTNIAVINDLKDLANFPYMKEKVYPEIEGAARNGHRSITILSESTDYQPPMTSIRKALEYLGYTVIPSYGNGGSILSIQISW